MSRRASVFYCIFVILVLAGVTVYFIQAGYNLRHERVASFLARGRQHAESLNETINNAGGIEYEVARAESIIHDDPSIVAVQVDTYAKGLRFKCRKG